MQHISLRHCNCFTITNNSAAFLTRGVTLLKHAGRGARRRNKAPTITGVNYAAAARALQGTTKRLRSAKVTRIKDLALFLRIVNCIWSFDYYWPCYHDLSRSLIIIKLNMLQLNVKKSVNFKTNTKNEINICPSTTEPYLLHKTTCFDLSQVILTFTNGL
jgi:hypothetical protein